MEVARQDFYGYANSKFAAIISGSNVDLLANAGFHLAPVDLLANAGFHLAPRNCYDSVGRLTSQKMDEHQLSHFDQSVPAARQERKMNTQHDMTWHSVQTLAACANDWLHFLQMMHLEAFGASVVGGGVLHSCS